MAFLPGFRPTHSRSGKESKRSITMNHLRIYLLALCALIACASKADEGMWLLQLMKQQHSIDMMKA